MKARAARSLAIVVTAPPAVTDSEASIMDAVKVLWPILHPDERTKYAALAALPVAQPALAERRAAWKAKIR